MRRIRTNSILVVALSVVISMTAMMTSCSNQKKAPEAQIGANAGPDGRPAPYREPVRLASKDGVLEVRLSAHQGTVNLDTVKQPVSNFLVFSYELIKGTSSDGSTKGDNIYPAPTLRVNPGERLIVHYDNDLQGLTIADFNDPAHNPDRRGGPDLPTRTRVGAAEPAHPRAAREPVAERRQRTAVHPGRAWATRMNTRFRRTCPTACTGTTAIGTPLTAQQTYMGLAGMLEIGRPDGNLPLVTKNNIPIRTMALQYNFVFDRKGGGHQLNNPVLGAVGEHAQTAGGQPARRRHVPPSLAPVNFAEPPRAQSTSPTGTPGRCRCTTTAGRTSSSRRICRPSRVRPRPSPRTRRCPRTSATCSSPSTASSSRSCKLKPGQTEIWVFANMSDIAFVPLQIHRDSDGQPPEVLDHRAGRQPVHPGAASRRRRWNLPRDSAGVALCRRGDDAEVR